MHEEELRDTPNKLIHIGRPLEFDGEEFCRQLEHLYEAANQDSETIRLEVQKIVPTYQVEGVPRRSGDQDGRKEPGWHSRTDI